ncbi:hypothetical protein MY3296_000620 [Beauveria thailandica]
MSHGINRQPPADAAHTQPPANVDDDDNDDAAIIEASRALEKKCPRQRLRLDHCPQRRHVSPWV